MINRILGPSAQESKDVPVEEPKEFVNLYNPDNEDFTTTYDINEDGKPLTYTIKSRQIAKFLPVIATHIKKHLATHVLNKQGVKKGSNWADEIEKIKKEIEVNI